MRGLRPLEAKFSRELSDERLTVLYMMLSFHKQDIFYAPDHSWYENMVQLLLRIKIPIFAITMHLSKKKRSDGSWLWFGYLGLKIGSVLHRFSLNIDTPMKMDLWGFFQEITTYYDLKLNFPWIPCDAGGFCVAWQPGSTPRKIEDLPLLSQKDLSVELWNLDFGVSYKFAGILKPDFGLSKSCSDGRAERRKIFKCAINSFFSDSMADFRYFILVPNMLTVMRYWQVTEVGCVQRNRRLRYPVNMFLNSLSKHYYYHADWNQTYIYLWGYITERHAQSNLREADSAIPS